MRRFLFNQVKKIIPKLSDTELIALRSGARIASSIDREIFRGEVDRERLFRDKPSPLKRSEEEYIRQTDTFLPTIGQDSLYPSKRITEVMRELGKNKYFSLIIDEKYGGNKLSYTAQTRLLTKISSYNPSLGVVVMVPNSLGPSELLQHYGTTKQQQEYLPDLAQGRLIPCFALTGPYNGSDATGSIDVGVLKNVEGKRQIELPINKRYITLAPVANLIGIAFFLSDPHKLLQGHGKEGITVALLQKGHKGLEQDTFHNPNHAGFPNGTIKGKIMIDLDAIIGGEDNAGSGWKMLMECLAVGRGISLPSSANGSSKVLTFSMFHYIRHRSQFKIPIGNMEGVKEKFMKMFYHSYVIQCSVAFIGHILDKGVTPPVLTAIMKQQTTERAREVLNLGMDIYAGSGICIGENNFFTKFYHSSPIGITVEGSNTLTRSLIIFGQGLNQSHPFIYDIFESIQDDDLTSFHLQFKDMVKHALSNYCKSIGNFSNDRLSLITRKFSNLSNFVALLGGRIKSKQMISGNMADVLSNIFLAHSVLWYFHHYMDSSNPNTLQVRDYIIDQLCEESERKINLVISNYPIPLVLYPTKAREHYFLFDKMNKMYAILQEDPSFINEIKKDLYYQDTTIQKLEQLSSKGLTAEEYNRLYDEIIQVGEYKIDKSS